MISKLINKLFGKKEETPETSNQELNEEQAEDDKHYVDFDSLHKQALVHWESAYRHQEIVFRKF